MAEERDILKERRHHVLRQRVKARCAFIKSRIDKYSIAAMCRVLAVNRAGFYAWLKQPKSARQLEDGRLLNKTKQCWIESGFASAMATSPEI